MSTNSKTFTQNALAGMAATGIHFVSRLVMAPMVLSFIDLEAYGLWSLMFVFLSYIAMGGFGIHSAYIKQTAEFTERDAMQSLNIMVSTGLTTSFVFVLVGLISVWFLCPVLISFFSIPPHMADIAVPLFLGGALCCLLDQSLGLYRSLLEGLHRIALVKKIQSFNAIIEIAAVFFFLKIGMGVLGLLYAYGLKILLDCCLCWWFFSKEMPFIKYRVNAWRWSTLKSLCSFGARVQLSGSLALFQASLDRLLVGNLGGLDSVGRLEIARKFPFTAKAITNASLGPFLPEASRLAAGDNPEKGLKGLYIKGLRHSFLLNIGIFLFIALMAGPLLTLWLGLGYASLAPVLVFLSLAYGVQQVTGALSLISRGLDRNRWEWLYATVMIVLTLALLPLGFAYAGLTGAAMMTAVSSLISSGLYLALGNRYFNVSLSQFLTTVVFPGLVPCIAGLGVFFAVSHLTPRDRLDAFLILLVAGTMYTFSTILLVWAVILGREEKQTLRALMPNFMQGARPC